MADEPGADVTVHEDRAELRRVVRDFCEREVTQDAVRAAMGTVAGHDPGAWRRLAADLDVLGLALPAEHGGSASGLLTLCVVAEELGRALLPSPFLGTVGLAATALVLSGDGPAQAEHLPRLVAGELLATVVAQDELGRWAPGEVTTRAARTDHGWRLDGVSTHVVDGASAGLLLVGAQVSDAVGLFLVAADAPGCLVEPMSTMDLTRRQAVVVLDGAPARPLGEVAQGRAVLERTGDVGAVLLAAMQVGTAQRLLDLSVEHARTRFQFGRPIGSFQGVKHRCADMLVAVEHARSTALHAAAVADAGSDGLPLAASLAAATASDAAVRVGADAVQVHGGLGFTWEHPVHLYYKRALGDAALLGTAAAHRERLATLVLDDPTSAAVPEPVGARS